ncbi:hypothetical protein BD324DRAFT_650378 [Kockovaella imperatae]|uniref:Uncharacterized protein n=1 Tax=Kockovaella imperatae TaxID=4999 RepID=A0A1Y1UIE7_9TREE|nr:hypothetical protein BD324DRAFT_650378 [Kockovaella imperatae]ORX37833.1 hypothetical protein BD324DRAFT_650378 [Kockovaella imperatae]
MNTNYQPYHPAHAQENKEQFNQGMYTTYQPYHPAFAQESKEQFNQAPPPFAANSPAWNGQAYVNQVPYNANAAPASINAVPHNHGVLPLPNTTVLKSSRLVSPISFGTSITWIVLGGICVIAAIAMMVVNGGAYPGGIGLLAAGLIWLASGTVWLVMIKVHRSRQKKQGIPS